jgi:hypothetical protein
MISSLRRVRPALLAALLVLYACGGGDAPADGAPDVADEASGEAEAAAEPAGDRPTEAAPTAAMGGPVPVVYLAAHGPAPSTYGPRCGDGIEGVYSDVFRITVPESWVQRGTSGGSGADAISFEVGGTRVTVDLFATEEEFRFEDEFEDLGETGVQVDLGGRTVPLHEVTMEGRRGYGILGVTYIEGLPRTGDQVGAVLVTSPEGAELSPEVAADVLGTVRVERCRAIAQLLIRGPAAGYQLVPEFDGGDPLGKERPDEDPPAYVPGESPLLTYSEDQVAYLLPLEDEVARCVAPLVRADAGANPILHLNVFVPSGTAKETLAEYVSQCTG